VLERLLLRKRAAVATLQLDCTIAAPDCLGQVQVPAATVWAESITRIEAAQFLPRSGIRFPQNSCLRCSYLGLWLGNQQLIDAKLNRCPGAEDFAWLDEPHYYGGPTMPPKLNRRRARTVRHELKQVGRAEAAELVKSRSDGQRFESAIWLHKTRELPQVEFKREVEKHLTYKDTEPYELVTFKFYKSQLPVVEQAIETASVMLGTDKSAATACSLARNLPYWRLARWL